MERAVKLNHDGVPEGIRTPDPLLRRQPLYPAELQGRGLSVAQEHITCKREILLYLYI